MEKFKEILDCSRPPIWIRKEDLLSDDKRKVVAFMVADYDLVVKRGEGFDERSDDILEKEKENFNEKLVLYKWQGSDFEKIEDIKNQNWFTV